MILPLALPVWSPLSHGATTVTCTGKSWVELSPGTLQREAIIVTVDPGGPPLSIPARENLLACDDGTGKDAPTTGDVSKVARVHAGQTIDEGTLRIITLSAPSNPNQLNSVIFAVNTIAGDDALVSRSGKGIIRVDYAHGIMVYPPSYALKAVIDRTIYEVHREPAKPVAPCPVSYEPDDAGAEPKVVTSPLDCATIVQKISSDDIFAGRLTPP